MHISNLLAAHEGEPAVRAAVIGGGDFATAMVTQARSIPGLDVRVVCDPDIEAALRAFARAGVDPQEILVCSARTTAERELQAGHIIVMEDPSLAVSLPLDIVAVAGGDAVTAAGNAMLSLEHGHHVAMVHMEADALVGPILAHEARSAGLIYSPPDGAQRTTVLQQVDVARQLGLEVLCAGLGLLREVVFDERRETAEFGEQPLPLGDAGIEALAALEEADTGAVIARRIAAREKTIGRRLWVEDVAALAVIANATGLIPDVEPLHSPALRISEMPGALCPTEDGGLLHGPERLECVLGIREPSGAGIAGGSFVNVFCETAFSRQQLIATGAANGAGGVAQMLYQPWHGGGVMAPLSLMAMARLGVTAAPLADYRPRVDVHGRARLPLVAGEVVPSHDTLRVEPQLRPAHPLRAGRPVPLPLTRGLRLVKDVAAGELIPVEAVDLSAESRLRSLREYQDRHFCVE